MIVTARRIARRGHQVASSDAVALDDHQPLDGSNRPVRGVLTAFPSVPAPPWPHLARTRHADPDEFADMLLTMADDLRNRGQARAR